MMKLRGLMVLSLLVTGACAKQSFSTRYRLTPYLAPANPGSTEFDRREIERRDEIELLQSERDDLQESLLNDHRVFLGEVGLFDAPAQWKETPDRERAEIATTLRRVVVVSRRKNFLIGRETADDPILQRAISLLRSLKNYRPVIEKYYGH